jgi:hypothetical protein
MAQPAYKVDYDNHFDRIHLKAEVVRRPGRPESWAVEAIDIDGDGDAFVAVFSGPGSKTRALEYGHAKFDTVEVRQ